MSSLKIGEYNFIDSAKLKALANSSCPTDDTVNDILDKALKLKGLDQQDVAALLQVEDEAGIFKIMQTAEIVKKRIYGNRMVLFAPLYTGNKCSNNCTYCGFRAGNKDLKRVILSFDQIRVEVEALLKDGHKRLLMLCGESNDNDFEYFMEALRVAYAANVNGSSIRRINVEIAPLTIEEFGKLKQAKIGTYACFQETYDPELYKTYHPYGPKADYEYRLTVMDRAMKGGIDDVGIGVLFGLADYKFEVLALLEHSNHLEQAFGCGPHTISVPRIEPADGAPLSTHIPYQVSDDDFKKIIAILRIALPYTGIILSTRETEALRNELFAYGVSQISAGSRTNPGAYGDEHESKAAGSQFSLGDHRSLDEVISKLIDQEYIPSFCTGCYRKGRVGQDFMDLAKPGLIQEFCKPNALFTFQEYLIDYAADATREKGNALVKKIINEELNENIKAKMQDAIKRIKGGTRDIYL